MTLYEVIRRPLVTEKGVEKKDNERTLCFEVAHRITLRESSNTSKLVPALAANVATAYLTITLLAIGYAMSTALGF